MTISFFSFLTGNGYLEFEEFLVLMTKNHANRGRAVEMKKIFETFDLDRSGKISAEELRESMAKLGESLSTPQGLFFYISCLLKILFCCDLNDEVRLKPKHT